MHSFTTSDPYPSLVCIEEVGNFSGKVQNVLFESTRTTEKSKKSDRLYRWNLMHNMTNDVKSHAYMSNMALFSIVFRRRTQSDTDGLYRWNYNIMVIEKIYT